MKLRRVANNYNPLSIVHSKAEGVWIEDPEGNKYTDMLGIML